MTSLKLGLIGCGRIAQRVHIPILSTMPAVNLVALAETDDARRAEVGQRLPNAQIFTNYHDLLAKADIEAVVICLPNWCHAEAARSAFDYGKHIYLEKPRGGSKLGLHF